RRDRAGRAAAAGSPGLDARARDPRARARRALDVREIGDERSDVERVVAEAHGDLLARRPRPLEEEVTQDVARLRAPPPVGADLADQVAAQLRRPDPG